MRILTPLNNFNSVELRKVDSSANGMLEIGLNKLLGNDVRLGHRNGMVIFMSNEHTNTELYTLVE